MLECWDLWIYPYYIPAKQGFLSPCPLIEHFSRLYHKASLKPEQGTPSNAGMGSQTSMLCTFHPSQKANTRLLHAFHRKEWKDFLLVNGILSQPWDTKVGYFCPEKEKDYSKVTHRLLEHSSWKGPWANFCLPLHPQIRKLKLREGKRLSEDTQQVSTEPGLGRKEEGKEDKTEGSPASGFWSTVPTTVCSPEDI